MDKPFTKPLVLLGLAFVGIASFLYVVMHLVGNLAARIP